LRFRVGGEVVAVDVDAEHLAEQLVGDVLRAVAGVAARAAVAGGDVEVAVGAEVDPAAVVVAEGLVDLQDDAAAERVGDVRVGADGVLVDEGVAADGVVDVELAVGVVVGVEGQAQQALLAAGLDGHLEERGGQQRAGREIEDADAARVAAALLEDEDAVEVARRVGHVDRAGEARDHDLCGQRRGPGGREARGGGDRRGGDDAGESSVHVCVLPTPEDGSVCWRGSSQRQSDGRTGLWQDTTTQFRRSPRPGTGFSRA
jgi:hypothetical protein